MCVWLTRRLVGNAFAELSRVIVDEDHRVEDQPVPENGDEERFDVLRCDEVAVVQQRPGPGTPLEREAASHRRADLDQLGVASRPHEVDDPALEKVVDVGPFHLRCAGSAAGCR